MQGSCGGGMQVVKSDLYLQMDEVVTLQTL